MNRRGFLKRMAFAALATVFLELPLPSEEPTLQTQFAWQELGARWRGLRILRSHYVPNGAAWVQDGTLFVNPSANLEELPS